MMLAEVIRFMLRGKKIECLILKQVVPTVTTLINRLITVSSFIDIPNSMKTL
jgi:hypothetical protein